VGGWCAAGRVGTGRVTLRYVSPSPPPTRTGGLHRIRLSPCGPSPRTMSRSLPSHVLSSTGVHPCTARAFAQYLCCGSFPKARGLRLQATSWRTRLSRALPPLPLPPPQRGIGCSLGSRLPTSTSLFLLPRVSRVLTVRRNREAVGGVCLRAPSALCGSRECSPGSSRLTCVA